MRYLAIDFGTKRLGLATCDAHIGVVSPYAARERAGTKRDVADLMLTIRGLSIEAIVFGLPRALQENQTNASETAVRTFATALETALREAEMKTEIFWWDERFSTVEAQAQGREMNLSQKRGRTSTGSDSIDARAAAVILRGFLDHKNQHHINDSRLT